MTKKKTSNFSPSCTESQSFGPCTLECPWSWPAKESVCSAPTKSTSNVPNSSLNLLQRSSTCRRLGNYEVEAHDRVVCLLQAMLECGWFELQANNNFNKKLANALENIGLPIQPVLKRPCQEHKCSIMFHRMVCIFEMCSLALQSYSQDWAREPWWSCDRPIAFSWQMTHGLLGR